MFRKELEYILNHYGEESQWIKFKEEEYELGVATFQHKLSEHEEKYKGQSRFCSKQTKEHLIEEIADVTVVSLQLLNREIEEIWDLMGLRFSIFPFIDENRNEIQEIMQHKIKRTIERIGVGK